MPLSHPGRSGAGEDGQITSSWSRPCLTWCARLGTARPLCQAVPCRCHLQSCSGAGAAQGLWSCLLGVPLPCTGSVWCVRFLGEPLCPQLHRGLCRDALVLSELSHVLPRVLECSEGRAPGAWRGREGKLDTSRRVGSEHHGAPTGPLHLSWSLELEGEQLWWAPTGSSARGCCWQQMSLLDLFGARYHQVVVVTKPPPGLASPPQSGSLQSPWSAVSGPLGPTHLFLRMALAELFAAGSPCASGLAVPHAAALECLQQEPEHCECTRTLQHVTVPGDTVENPSSKRLVVCWRRSISSCWHSPAFVHHIWPRRKPSRAQVSFPTCPSTMPAWQPGRCRGSGAGHGAAEPWAPGRDRGSAGAAAGPGWVEVGRDPSEHTQLSLAGTGT
ncbi:uncharacterized protein LOC118693605 [Molothrus ater]|uniref:uncharacterized protein LOC118693605 n=1 Tax=Molothrus ater TaxID=84834 RepID=UPI00174C68F6|nr:uncharacterized protein LOC118693605 [Molothrus ater]XP_054372867.1 uncharacterized protein LOC118693605 [Molothrus ater]